MIDVGGKALVGDEGCGIHDHACQCHISRSLSRNANSPCRTWHRPLKMHCLGSTVAFARCTTRTTSLTEPTWKHRAAHHAQRCGPTALRMPTTARVPTQLRACQRQPRHGSLLARSEHARAGTRAGVTDRPSRRAGATHDAPPKVASRACDVPTDAHAQPACTRAHAG